MKLQQGQNSLKLLNVLNFQKGLKPRPGRPCPGERERAIPLPAALATCPGTHAGAHGPYHGPPCQGYQADPGPRALHHARVCR